MFKFSKYVQSTCSNPEIYPKSSNVFCLPHHRPMLWNWKYSRHCVVYFGYCWRKSFTNEIHLVFVFGRCSWNCLFAFNKSSHMEYWTETLPQEETETTGKLDSSCSKLDSRNIFVDCRPHRRMIVLPG